MKINIKTVEGNLQLRYDIFIENNRIAVITVEKEDSNTCIYYENQIKIIKL